MNILVLNSGSSSLKFQLIKTGQNFEIKAKGLIDTIGLSNCKFTFKSKQKNIEKKISIKNHEEAL